MPLPLTACPELVAEDEARVDLALDAMLALEDLLESQPPRTELPASSILALVRLVHQSVREVMLWQPPSAANDNG